MAMQGILDILQDQLAITIAWLPFLLASTIGLLAILTMNVPFMMFTAGLVGTMIGGTVLGKVLHVVTNFLMRGRVPVWTPAPRCGVMPPVLPDDVQSISVFVPSPWIMAVTFMFVYIFQAGAEMLQPGGLPPWIDDGAHPEELNNAQNTAVIILFTVGIVAAWILLHRMFLTGCESPVPAILGLVVGGVSAYGWYQIARTCPRWIADIFGITARFPPAATGLDGASAQCTGGI
jgi:hypothetical protein